MKKHESKNEVAYVSGSADESSYRFGVVMTIDDRCVAKITGQGEDPEFLALGDGAGAIVGCLVAVEQAVSIDRCEFLTVCCGFKGVEKWATGEWKAESVGASEYFNRLMKLAKKIDISFTEETSHMEYMREAEKLAGN